MAIRPERVAESAPAIACGDFHIFARKATKLTKFGAEAGKVSNLQLRQKNT